MTQKPALAQARIQPSLDSAAEAMMLDLLIGEPRSTLMERVDEAEQFGELDRLLPDLETPTREDAERFVDDLIREYQQLVPKKSADALALETVHQRLVERGVAVVFGAPAYDTGEGAHYGFEAAQSLPNAVGYCYSHMQDVCRLAIGLPLYIGFSSMAGQLDDDAAAVGRIVVEELERAGFNVSWGGDPRSRIEVYDLVWEVPTKAQPRP